MSITVIKRVSQDLQIAINEALDSPSQFSNELSAIRNAGEGDEVNLFLNTPGGCVYTGIQFRSVIMKCNAPVIAHLESGCHSAGTTIALSCDDLIVSDDAFMLIHNYSAGSWGKATDLIAHVLNQDAWIKTNMRNVYKHFLTEDEIENKLFKSEDIYLTANEIRDRWELVIAAREEANEKEADELREQIKDKLNSETKQKLSPERADEV